MLKKGTLIAWLISRPLNLKRNGSVTIDKKFQRDIEKQIPKVFETRQNLDTYLQLLPKIKDNVAYTNF